MKGNVLLSKVTQPISGMMNYVSTLVCSEMKKMAQATKNDDEM